MGSPVSQPRSNSGTFASPGGVLKIAGASNSLRAAESPPWRSDVTGESVDQRLRSRPLTAAGDRHEPSTCRICASRTVTLGSVHGSYSDRDYKLRRCESCRYAYIADPWTDFARIYDDHYYVGRGADPLVDYQFELDSPAASIRIYE